MRAWSFTKMGDATPMVKHARQAVRDGFAVVFLKPGRKDPLCPLTAREKQKAGPNHPCGVAHATTDEKTIVRWGTRLEKEHGAINLGIAAHASGVVVIDADTSEQVESVVELLRQMGDVEELYGLQPTVRTPGVERNGVWVHESGTHWYFNRPEGLELPQYPGAIGLPGGAVMRWGNSYTVVPPSVRAEGRYVSLAEVIPDVPLGLVALINAKVAERAHAAADVMSLYVNDPVIEWSVQMPWAELLEPEGWQFLGKMDHVCGCPVWRRPGEDMTSDRSAIAHENDCPVRQNYEGHGSLHIFSDNVPGPLNPRVAEGIRDFTKLQFVAITRHGGDTLVAQVALGLLPDYANLDFTNPEAPRAEKGKSPGQGQDPKSPPPKDTGMGDSGDDGSFWMPDETEEVRGQIRAAAGKQRVARRGSELVDYIEHGVAGTEELTVIVHGSVDVTQSSTPTVGFRADGVPLLYAGRVNCIFGRSEQGKSWFTLACAIDALFRGQRVLLIDVEDDYAGFDARMLELGLKESPAVYTRINGVLSVKGQRRLTQLAEQADLVIVDSFDGLLAVLGYEEGQLDVRRAGAFLKRLATAGGAAVLLVDHSSEKDTPGKDVRDQMGSSAKKQFIDGALFFAKALTPWKPNRDCQTIIEIGKDRHGATKSLGIFETETAKWGRVGLLHKSPAVAGPAEIRILPPPTYEDVPDVAVLANLLSVENRVLDFLRLKPNEWQPETVVLGAAGDKNGRGNQPYAIAKLVEIKAIEKQTVELRGGRTGTEYRYVPLDEEDS